LAMDARGFGSGPRTRFRTSSFGAIDLALAVGGGVALVGALALG